MKNFKKILVLSILMVFVVPIFVLAQSEVASTSDVVAEDLEKNEEVVDPDVVAQMISVSPSVIDENFEKSAIGKYSIKLKNHTDKKLGLYANVNNISSSDGRLRFDTVSSKERSVSAANWILIRRGVIELMPYEEVSVPLEIRVAMNAIPGKYYVSISFPAGSNRAGATNSMKNKSYAETRINIDITENIIEKAQIKKFITTKNVYFSNKIDFELNIENSGNRQIDPFGYIYVFNRKGAEVAKIEISKGDHNLGIDQINEIEKTWLGRLASGKHKAKIELEYGKNGTRDLQDTLFFWVLPWKMLLTFTSLMIVLLVILIFIIFRKTYKQK
jgi:hypothetical protein